MAIVKLSRLFQYLKYNIKFNEIITTKQKSYIFSTLSNPKAISDTEKDHITNDYDMFVDINKANKKTCQNVLLNLLHLPKSVISKFMAEYPVLKKTTPKDLLTNYQILVNFGINRMTIRQNVYLLTLKKEELADKLGIISEFSLDMNEAVFFIKLHIKNLERFLNTCRNQNITPADKINFFCDFFKVRQLFVCLFFFYFISDFLIEI